MNASEHCLCERCENAVIAGVCAGIAKKLDADPIVVRVSAVVLGFCTCGLVAIPYIICALKWPCAHPKDQMLDVAPTSVASERYQKVVKAFEHQSLIGAGSTARTDSGHVPPAPPAGGVAASLSYPIFDSVLLAADQRRREYTPLVVSFSLGVALVVLFALVALAVKRYVPTASFVGFWPLLLLAAGIAVFACPTKRISLPVRLCVLLLCVEFCVASLPFSLGVCPPVALYRVGVPSFVLAFASLACVVCAVAAHKQEFLIGAVFLLGLAILLAWGDIGTLDRISIIQNDFRRGVPPVPFK